MADTKKGRNKKARDADKRQRERDMEEARDRADESDPSQNSPRKCHRRNCNEAATFVVVERYQEETGQGAVEAEAALCREHTAEESPVNLDGVYDDYLFQVKPISTNW